MEIPGLAASHSIITDQCRENRGDAGALDEALARLRHVYEGATQGWEGTPGVRFHVVLSVEPPPRSIPDGGAVAGE